MDNVELFFEKITTFPQYPTIGEILRDIADIPGYTEKEFDPKRDFRKKLQRLAKQDVGKINLDNYRKLLLQVMDRYKSITCHHTMHWIDEAQVLHFFYAYQELILTIPMLGVEQKTINSFVGTYFLIWSIRRYVRWIQLNPNVFQDYAELWILRSLNPALGIEAILSNLKVHLGDVSMTDWKMVSLIHKGAELSQEKHNNYCRQIKGWQNKGKIPKYTTVLAKIIEPLRENHHSVARIFELDFLCWRWLDRWIDYINLDKDEVVKFLNLEFQNSLMSSEPVNTIIPSREMGLEGLRHPDIRETFQRISRLFHDSFSIEDWAVSNIYPVKRWPDRKDNGEILKSLELSEYRHGEDFHGLCDQLLQSHESDSPYFEKIYKIAYLHGLIPSKYRDTKLWLEYQTKSSHSLEFKDISLLNLDEEDRDWLYNWNPKSINQYRAFEGINRTRLMVAVYRGDVELVKKLMNDGADQCIISQNNSSAKGDNSSALLITLLAFEAPPPSLVKIKKNYERIVMLLINQMRDLDEEKVKGVLNTRHSITKRVPLNIAICMGRLSLTNTLISLGTEINAEIGGDDHTPIYEGIDALFQYQRIRSYRSLKYQMQRSTSNTMRMETGPSQLELMETISGTEIVEKLMDESIKYLNDQKPKSSRPYKDIITTLAKNGADLNKLNCNGRYPLDMAIEHGEDDIVKIITKLGAYKRAVL